MSASDEGTQGASIGAVGRPGSTSPLDREASEFVERHADTTMAERHRLALIETAPLIEKPARHDGRLHATVQRLTRSERNVALAQAAYFSVTGIWPLLNMKTFEWITGPKVDDWLVKTVGLLVAVAGGAIGAAAARRRINDETRFLAIGSAAALGLIDVVYVARRRISPIYLLDAALEAGLIAAWAAARPASPPSAAP